MDAQEITKAFDEAIMDAVNHAKAQRSPEVATSMQQMTQAAGWIVAAIASGQGQAAAVQRGVAGYRKLVVATVAQARTAGTFPTLEANALEAALAALGPEPPYCGG
jgi:hypothetical protein